MDELDTRNLLLVNQFSAVNFDNLPKCAPEDLNFSTVAERQQQTEVVINQLVSAIADLSPKSTDGLTTASASDIASTMKAVENLNEKLSKSLSAIQSQLDNLGEICKHSIQSLQSSHSTQSARSPASPPYVVNQSIPSQSSRSSRTPAFPHSVSNQPTPAADIDRSKNVVIFGISEDKNSSVWQKQVSDVLAFVVGSVQINDVFRLGHYASDTIRPVLVRLHSAWDRRLILSNAVCLHGNATWGNVFIRPDVSLPERRVSTMKRIRTRAEQCGKLVSMNDGNLSVDNVLLYSVSSGWVVDANNAVRVSLFNNSNAATLSDNNNNNNNNNGSA